MVQKADASHNSISDKNMGCVWNYNFLVFLENNEESVYLTEQQTALLKASTKLNSEQYNALFNFLEKL